MARHCVLLAVAVSFCLVIALFAIVGLSLGIRCSGGSTPHAASNVSDEDILKVSEELFQLDGNNVAGLITLDMQGKTSSNVTDDVAHKPLFKSVSEAALTGETFKLFEALRDNYIPQVDKPEDNTPEDQAEVTAFLDAAMATPLMVHLDQFMTEKGVLPSGSLRENIERVWFTMYPRSENVVGSSGFEHSFVGELEEDIGNVGGLHNWVSYYREESKGNLNYKGYIDYAKLEESGYLYSSRFNWYDANKPLGSGYIGTSPEFDLAIFSLCFFTRPNAQCDVQTNGVKHYVQTNQMEYKDQVLVATAYPVVPESS